MKEMFSESGDISMMRIIAFICVITACGVAIAGLAMDKDINAIAMLCGTFLGAGITGKVVQRSIEVKDVR